MSPRLSRLLLALALLLGALPFFAPSQAQAQQLAKPVITLTAITDGVVVTWNAIDGANDYAIQSLKGQGTPEPAVSVGNVTSHKFTSFIIGNEYYVRAIARDTTGTRPESGWSGWTSITPYPPTAPGVPRNVQVTPGDNKLTIT